MYLDDEVVPVRVEHVEFVKVDGVVEGVLLAPLVHHILVLEVVQSSEGT